MLNSGNDDAMLVSIVIDVVQPTINDAVLVAQIYHTTETDEGQVHCHGWFGLQSCRKEVNFRKPSWKVACVIVCE